MSRRVLYIIGTGAVGGAERQLVGMVRALPATGWEPSVVFSSSGGPIEEEIRSLGVQTWVAEGLSASRSGASRAARLATLRDVLSAASMIRHAVRTWKPDVVHALLPTSVWLGLSTFSAKRAAKVAGVLGFTPAMSWRIRPLYTLRLRRAAAVVCNAPHLVNEMVGEHGVASERVVFIPQGVDVPEWSSDPGVEPPEGVMVANFHAYKGHDVLLRALAEISPKVRVRLCGVGAERELMRDLAVSLGLSDHVIFVDPPAEVPRELRTAQFLVHPSRTEGLPNAVLEAMAAGLPIVASDVGGIPTLIDDGVNGLLVPPSDVKALADALRHLIAAPEARISMGNESRRLATGFSWSASMQAHADLYSRLAAR
jgi:glycosyltransferase involved in cell wall biosynthesis